MHQTMACELLALTELDVGDISAALNFANHSAFVRALASLDQRHPCRVAECRAVTLAFMQEFNLT